MDSGYFKIGEFAKICGVKKATLIHYAQMGLLTPAKVGDNGYSYYLPSQLYDFELINVLKSLNVPLADIKDYIENKNGDIPACEAILKNKLKEIEEIQKRISSAKSLIENTIKDLDDMKNQTIGVVEEITFDKPDYLYVYDMPYRDADSAYVIGKTREVIAHIQDSFMNEDINVVEVVLHEDIMNETFRKTYGAFRARNSVNPNDERVIVKPAGTYLTIADKSGGNQIAGLYRTLKQYADDRGYKIVGNAFARDLVSHIIERNRDSYLVRCYIQIEKEKK